MIIHNSWLFDLHLVCISSSYSRAIFVCQSLILKLKVWQIFCYMSLGYIFHSNFSQGTKLREIRSMKLSCHAIFVYIFAHKPSACPEKFQPKEINWKRYNSEHLILYLGLLSVDNWGQIHFLSQHRIYVLLHIFVCRLTRQIMHFVNSWLRHRGTFNWLKSL